MTEISRRAVLSTGGRAAVATLALGGVSLASEVSTSGKTGDDPIFRAINAHRTMHNEWLAIYDSGDPRGDDDDLMGEYCEGCADAAWAMLDTEPTTVAGVAALLAYVSDHWRQGRVWPELQRINGQLVNCGNLEINAIDFAARTLARLTGGQANV